MKYISIFYFFGAIALTGFSCKKGSLAIRSLGSVAITNVIVGGETVMTNLIPTTTLSSNITVAYSASGNFNSLIGSQVVYIYPQSDSSKPYFNKRFNFSFGDFYSIFLAGQFPTIDTVIIKEDIPIRTDSSFGIRFINLSPNAPAVNITLSTSTSINEFTNIGYKTATTFKTYPAKFTSPASFTFQVRNAASNVLITSTTITGASLTTGIPRFHDITLILRGLIGGTPAVGLTRINHFR